ncbi:MAG: ABC transporter permease, partial [Bacteroidota bacterium]
ASLWNIFVLLNRQTLLITLLALGAGVPLAGFLLTQWLDSFAYQITLGWSFYASMIVAILLLVLGTVSYYGWQAGRMNPADSLRDE